MRCVLAQPEPAFSFMNHATVHNYSEICMYYTLACEVELGIQLFSNAFVLLASVFVELESYQPATPDVTSMYSLAVGVKLPEGEDDQNDPPTLT